jgi:hypothetical protein
LDAAGCPVILICILWDIIIYTANAVAGGSGTYRLFFVFFESYKNLSITNTNGGTDWIELATSAGYVLGYY